MGFTPLVDLKRQEDENREKNSRLNALIFKNKKNKGKLEDIQIVRFGNDLVVAIYNRPQEQEGNEQAEKGNFGEIYTAYPITCSGKISKIPLKVKINKDTERTLDDSGEEILQEKAASTRYDEDSGKTIAVPAVTLQTHAARNEAIVREAKANQTTFSARTTRIPRKEKVDGKTVYETVILMSTVPGVSLDKLYYSVALTREQRLRLAINVIKAYEDLHKKGIFHRDIKSENIMVDPGTLEVTVIDRDNSGSDRFIRAPEDDGKSDYIPTPESEIYSLAQDVLPAILSGVRPLTESEHLADEIGPSTKSGINLKFSGRNPPQDKENDTSKAIKGILNKMRFSAPNDRGTLAEAREGLEAQLMVVTKNDPIPQDEKAIKDYQRSLRQLDSVLQSPKYRIRDEYRMEDKPNPIEDAYNETVTETIFRLEQLSAEIISDFTKTTDNEGNEVTRKIPADKVAEYNHHQCQLAILMKEKTYLSLKISDQNTATVVTHNTETKEPVNVPAKKATTTPIYFLAETLKHICLKPEKSTTNLTNPTRIQFYSGNALELAEKLSLLKKFKKEFDAFFVEKATDFCKGIRDIFNNISNYLEVPEGRNPAAFFYHAQDKSPVPDSKGEKKYKKS